MTGRKTKTDHIAAIMGLFETPETELSPTEIGLALGYEHVNASSRVGPYLRLLVEMGKLVKHKRGHNVVRYQAA